MDYPLCEQGGADCQVDLLPEVMEQTRFSRSTIYRQLNDPMSTFPRPIKLGGKLGWYRHEVRAWLESRPRLYAQPGEGAGDGSAA